MSIQYGYVPISAVLQNKKRKKTHRRQQQHMQHYYSPGERKSIHRQKERDSSARGELMKCCGSVLCWVPADRYDHYQTYIHRVYMCLYMCVWVCVCHAWCNGRWKCNLISIKIDALNCDSNFGYGYTVSRSDGHSGLRVASRTPFVIRENQWVTQ